MSYNSGTECDTISGKHVTLMDTKILKRLSDPFLLPFTDALYIQTTALGVKVRVHLISKPYFGVRLGVRFALMAFSLLES